MLRLQQDRSYAWLFAVFAVFFLGGFALCEAVGQVGWGILTLPAFIAFLLSCELRSDIALDSWWRARYPKGCWQFKALIAWHVTGLVLLSIFSFFFIHLSVDR